MDTKSTLNANVASFFDADTSTFTHVVWDQRGGHAAVIDPVLGFDPPSGRTTLLPLTPVLDLLKEQQLELAWILETHAHADHITAAPLLQEMLGGRIAIGKGITQVQQHFKSAFNLGDEQPTDGAPFDQLFEDGEEFRIGNLRAIAWHVPGHTPADLAYIIGNSVFVGDTLFPPDVGTARTDFPGGSAVSLYRSMQRLLALSPEMRLYMCHDYPPTQRSPIPWTTVGTQRASNIHCKDGISEEAYVQMRQARDKVLAAPRLIIPSIQLNIRAGHWPTAETNGTVFLKQPIRPPKF